MVSTFFDIGSYGFSSKVKVVYDENDGTLQYSLRDAHANDFLAQTVSAKDDSNIEEIIRKANLCNFVLRKAKDYVEDKGD
ncbi:MAG: hypothetical protein Q8O99_06555 [bacterium]|nr:hypothetical protein [bacterium]